MKITDNHIKAMMTRAQIDQAIELCKKSLAEMAAHEQNARNYRIQFETYLRDLEMRKVALMMFAPFPPP